MNGPGYLANPIPTGTNTIGNVKLAGANSRIATIDGNTYAQNTIEYFHHEVHAGNAYFAVYSQLKDDTETIEVRIQTANTTKWSHMEIIIDSALAATAEMWFATTKTHVAGNAITPLNKDFNSSNTSGMTICHTPAGSQAGNANLQQYLGAASTNGRINEGGGTGSRGEFILKQNTAYLIKMTSRADSNAMSIILNWYEHTNLE